MTDTELTTCWSRALNLVRPNMTADWYHSTGGVVVFVAHAHDSRVELGVGSGFFDREMSQTRFSDCLASMYERFESLAGSHGG